MQGSNRTGFTGFPGLTGFFYPQITQIRNEIIGENLRNLRMKRCDWVTCLLRDCLGTLFRNSLTVGSLKKINNLFIRVVPVDNFLIYKNIIRLDRPN
ncbi:MAG: hypothetical protein [Olavius algarvensis Gamma 1 endosymbiont]|nr:MAG: hypothetical protein [Olavius algarvensis Gamma 1 endosymbiont]